ncbi:MAG: CHASE2 domain-containing protein [Burkholderiales bacterium]|nr:CHASE2 domain-containing protein [Burkholderiales bacterium]
MQYRSQWWRDWFVVAAALGTFAFLTGVGSWAWQLDQIVYDAGLLAWQRPGPKDIVVVAIDDDSLEAVGRWPWRRAIHATAISRIAAAHPKAILLDVLLSEPDADPRQDELLATAIRQAGNVVLPVAFAANAMGTGRELRPIAILADAARQLAHSDVELDPDGVLRSAYLQAGWGAPSLPQLAVALLDVGAEHVDPSVRTQKSPVAPPASFSRLAPSWQRDHRVLIRYSGPVGQVRRVSYMALLRGDVPVSELKDKYVLIGATAAALGDSVTTPVSGGSPGMPAVDVIAQLLDMLRTGATLQAVPPLVVGLISAILVVALMLALRRLTPKGALLVAGSAALGSALVSLLLIRAGVWFAPTSFALAAFAAYPLWSWRRLESTHRFLDEELTVLLKEPGIALPKTPALATDQVQMNKMDPMEQRIVAIKAATERVREARRCLSAILETLPAAVFLVDALGRVQQANHQACGLVGVTETQALKEHPLEHLLRACVPTDAPHWSMLLERAISTGEVITTEARNAGGDTFLARVARLQVNGGARHDLVVCLTDVSLLRQAEQQRDELLGFIAHDLRSPQASLISLVQLQRICSPPLPEAEVLAHVESLARSTLHLCDELLQVMRAEHRPIERSLMDLVITAQAAVDEVEPQARSKQIEIVREWSSHGPALALIDDVLVRRALINLLTNAIKFSPSFTRVTMQIEQRDAFWILSVRDQGPGIPKAELPKLFRRYQRLDNGQRSTMAPGIGLGLVFIETVARRHGGHVHVESEEGIGSRFEMALPVDHSQALVSDGSHGV